MKLKYFLLALLLLLACKSEKPSEENIALMPGLWTSDIDQSLIGQVVFDSEIFLYIEKLDGGNVYGALFHHGGLVYIDGWDLPECYAAEFETTIQESSEGLLKIDCFDKENEICIDAVVSNSKAEIFIKYGNFILMEVILDKYNSVDDDFYLTVCDNQNSYIPVVNDATVLTMTTTNLSIPELFLTCESETP